MVFEYSPRLGTSDLSIAMQWSSEAHACIFLYESLPFSVNLSHGFGLDNNSLTVPWDNPSTNLANSRCPILCTDNSSRTHRAMFSVLSDSLAHLSMLLRSDSCSLASDELVSLGEGTVGDVTRVVEEGEDRSEVRLRGGGEGEDKGCLGL